MSTNRGLQIKPRPNDYVLGSNSPLVLKSVNNGDWNPYLFFAEKQSNPLFDSNGCACYDSNKVLDVWVNFLLPTFPANVITQLTQMGFMDSNSLDSQPHFHSSPWFTENLTGNGNNGNSIPECFDVIRKYGAIPYTQFNFTSTTTPTEYFVKPSAAQLALGLQFLNLMGRKNFLQYHFVANNSPKNLPQMVQSITQSPLSLGINVDDAGWNQVTPVDPPNDPPVHAVMAYNIFSTNVYISDNYVPYLKSLDAGYPINYVLQAIVNPIFPIQPGQPIPPAPTLPPSPTIPQIQTWLQKLIAWLQSLQKVGSVTTTMNPSNYSLLKSKTFWSAVLLFVFNGFNAISGSIPSAYSVPINFVLTALVGYFHLTGMNASATSSAALGKAVSGQ